MLFAPASFALVVMAAVAAAPEYQTIPAARTEELTPALADGIQSYREWSRSHSDNGSSRYSRLDQINRDNVKRLQVAWTYHSNDGKGNIECNPVIVKGVMYAPTAGSSMVAIDAATGHEIWRFKPAGRPAYRGLVHWAGDAGHGPRIYFTAGDWLYALDSGAGRGIASFGESGRVRARATVAPAIYKNIIILPCWNVVKAFDLFSGKTLWSFDLIPGEGEAGHETWTGPGYGANSWGGLALDSARGIAYISTGSPHPNYLGMHHRGDNLFANCVVALKAETGERLWHFQEIRHDIWDLDIPAPPNLVTVTRNGRKYDAVAQVTKIGNTLLLDRLTGKPLFPFRLRRAPASALDGEQTAEWQPDLETPEPFARQVFMRDDVTDISPQAHAFVLEKIAHADLGWFAPFRDNVPLVFYGMHGGAEWTGAAFDPASGWLYVSSNELPWIVTIRRAKLPPRRKPPYTAGNQTYLQYCAACHGPDRDGMGMGPPLFTLPGRFSDGQVIQAFRQGRGSMPAIPVPENRVKGLLDFLSNRDLAGSGALVDSADRYTYRFAGYGRLLDQNGRPGVKPPWGTLNAIDLNTGRIAWKVPLGNDEELTKAGVPPTGTENFGGASVTAGGLVFCAGTRDLKIRAFDSHSGAELWEYKMPFGGFAPPATYEVNGRQYVVIASTGGGKLGGPLGDAYIAFALPK
jgi:quinoprotein glucose dehydrogenase